MKEGWVIKEWKDVLEIKSGRNQKDVLNENGKYPILGSAGKVMGYADDYICEAQTTIIGRKGSINNPLFIKERFWNVDTAFGLQAFDELDKYFLHYFCLSFDFSKMDRGSGRPSLVKSDLLKIQIPIPPLPEQKQIVAILDKAFAAIHHAQAHIEKNIANAKELFQSKLNEIFSQKGEGWEVKTLGEIGEVQTGTTPSTKDKANYGDYIPFAKPPHFREDGRIDTKNSMLSKKGLEKGRLFKANSILMVCIGATIGKTGFSEKPISSNQQINALTPNEDYIPKLLYYSLISPFVQGQVMAIGKSSQATLPIINKSKWLKLKVNVPIDRTTQVQIVEVLENLKKLCMKTESHYQQKLTNLEELKKSLLQKAFAGEFTSPEGTQYDKEVRSASARSPERAI